MSERWERENDPIENRLFNVVGPDAQISDMRDVTEQIREMNRELESESIEISERMMRVVVKMNQTQKKSRRVEELIHESINS